MDDSYVTKCNEQQAMSQNAYVLLYEKVKDEPMEKQQKEEMKEETLQKQQAKVNGQVKEKLNFADLQRKL